MKIVLAVLPAILFAELCAVDPGIGMGSGMITVHNGDDNTHEIVVSDNALCNIGLKGELHGDTTRTYDIDEKGAYFCVGGGGGVKVENGGSYIIRGGAMSAR